MPKHETLQLVRTGERTSLLARIRSYMTAPLTLKSPELARVMGSQSSATGISVSEQSALNFSAVWSAVNLISGDIASLPLVLYRVTNTGKEKYTTHALYRLLHDQPNPEMTSIAMRRTIQAHALTWGNGFAEIERDGMGRPIALWPLLPNMVEPFRERGVLRYKVYSEDGSFVPFDASDILHVPGLGWDGTTGYSVIAKARESVGLGIAAEKFGGSFYGNGATFGGVFEHPGKMSPTAQENFRNSITARHGGVDRAHKFLVTEEGMKYQRLGIPPNDAQFLETRQFQVLEIARWFNLPPHKLAHLSDATFSNVEQQNIDYFTSCLRPWLETWEQECKSKLISRLELNTQDIEHVTEGLLRADSAGRAALETAHFNIGSATPNDIRKTENRPLLEGGNDAFVPLNMVPLSRVGKWWDLQIEEKQASIEKMKQPPPPVPAAGDPAKDETIASQGRKIQELADKAELLTVALTEARAEAVRLTGEWHDQNARYQREIERGAALDAEVQRQAAECAAALAKLAMEEAERLDVVGMLDSARADGLKVDEAYRVLLQQVVDQDAKIGTLEARVSEQSAALVDVAQKVITETTRADLASAALESAQRELTQAGEALATAQAAAAHATNRADQADRDRGIAEQAQAATNTAIETMRQREAKRLSDVITAHRALMVDAMGRMIRRETEKARRHQATPQKLRAWAETFYPDHMETVAEAILPTVRAHLAWLQSDKDPAAEARSIADAHVAHARQQIEHASQIEDYQPTLAKVLERLETKQPESVADALVAEGIRYVRDYR